MGGTGGPAGTTGGEGGGTDAVTAGGAAAAGADGLPAGSDVPLAVIAEAGGAGVTGGTGSARSGVGSLPAFSFGASTLAVSDLAASGLASPAGFAASDFSASVLTSVLASTLADLDESSLAVSLAASSDFGSSSGLPRLPSFCLAPALLSVAACAGVWPSAGLAASGVWPGRRLPSRPGRPLSCGDSPSASGRDASCVDAAGFCRRALCYVWRGDATGLQRICNGKKLANLRFATLQRILRVGGFWCRVKTKFWLIWAMAPSC